MQQKKEEKNKKVIEITGKARAVSRLAFRGIDRINISNEDKMYLIENISLLIHAGVPIINALDSLKRGKDTSSFSRLIDTIIEKVESGVPLARALKETRLFPEYTITLLSLGEISGRLPENLLLIVAQQRKNREFKSKIKSALMYPVFVMVITILVASGVSLFILPKLSHVFSSMNIELPTLTRMLISVGGFFEKYGSYVIPIMLLVMSIGIFFLFFYKKTKFIGESILLVLPGIGKVMRETENARFGYMMGSLLSAGFAITDVFNALIEASTLETYKKLYIHMQSHIVDGDSFKVAFESYPRVSVLIPKTIQQVIVTGSQSGTLASSLLELSLANEAKSEISAKNLTVILEPVLLVIVWLGVVAVALAIILPLYTLIGNLNA